MKMKSVNENISNVRIRYFINLSHYQMAATEAILSTNAVGDKELFCPHTFFCFYPQLIDQMQHKDKAVSSKL